MREDPVILIRRKIHEGQGHLFASLRDAVGTGTETVELAGDAASVAQVREALIAKGEAWAHAFRNLKRIRAAVNQELAGDDAVVKEGDEVAFFPPVTGG